MSPSIVSKLLLVLTITWLTPSAAQLRKTKGVNNKGQRILHSDEGDQRTGHLRTTKGISSEQRVLHEESEGKGKQEGKAAREEKVPKVGGGKQKNKGEQIDVSEETSQNTYPVVGVGAQYLDDNQVYLQDRLDEDETTYALGEVGQPIYVGEAEAEGAWNFVDQPGYDREDAPSNFVIDLEPAGDQEETNIEEAGDPEDEDAGEVVATQEDVTGNESDPMEQTGWDDNTAVEIIQPGGEIVEVPYLGMEEMTGESVNATAEGVYLHGGADTEQDMEKLEEDESDLIANDGSNLTQAEDISELEARLFQAEIQLDTLQELSKTVSALQEQLDYALETIASQEKAINTLAQAVMGPVEEGYEPPTHITSRIP